MAIYADTARLPTAPTSGDNFPETIISVRGVPVRIADRAAHAVRFGYFPISSTGYRNFGCGNVPSAAELEERAQEADRERGQILHRLRQAKSFRARTADERFSAWISLEGAISSAVGAVFLAPPSDQDKLLREIATTSDILKPFLEPGYASPFNPGAHWTEELLVQRAQAYYDLCRLTCRILARLCQRPASLEAWQAFVDALPRDGTVVIVPAVVRAALARAAAPSSADPASDILVTPPPVAPVEFAVDGRGQYSLL